MWRTAVVLLIAVSPVVAGCSSSKGAAQASCSETVNTPGGPAPKACVHQVPNGATVSERSDGTTVVTLNGQVVATYPPCPCPAPTCTDRSGVTHGAGLPWTDGCAVCSCGDLGDGKLSAICSHNTCPPDASADSDPATGADGDAASSADGDAASSADGDAASGPSCPGPIAADAGVTTLDDLPIPALCARSPDRLFRWTTVCGGSIVVVLGEGVDCASYWLFDATTKQLQATAHRCVGAPVCTGGLSGFTLPPACFNDDFVTDVVKLCPSGAGDAAADRE